jgi:hypothetical protein
VSCEWNGSVGFGAAVGPGAIVGVDPPGLGGNGAGPSVGGV